MNNCSAPPADRGIIYPARQENDELLFSDPVEADTTSGRRYWGPISSAAHQVWSRLIQRFGKGKRGLTGGGKMNMAPDWCKRPWIDTKVSVVEGRNRKGRRSWHEDLERKILGTYYAHTTPGRRTTPVPYTIPDSQPHLGKNFSTREIWSIVVRL